MSGGYWEYLQYRFTDVIEDIKQLIERNGKEIPIDKLSSQQNEEWVNKYPEDKFYTKYPEEVINEFKNAVDIISRAQVYMQRIDYLLSGDDGDETFIKRLEEDLNKLKEYE